MFHLNKERGVRAVFIRKTTGETYLAGETGSRLSSVFHRMFEYDILQFQETQVAIDTKHAQRTESSKEKKEISKPKKEEKRFIFRTSELPDPATSTDERRE